MDLIIEKNIPIPSKDRGKRGTLRKLNVGESCEFPEAQRNSVGTTITSYFHKETDLEFTTSNEGASEGHFRVWRVK